MWRRTCIAHEPVVVLHAARRRGVAACRGRRAAEAARRQAEERGTGTRRGGEAARCKQKATGRHLVAIQEDLVGLVLREGLDAGQLTQGDEMAYGVVELVENQEPVCRD